MIEAQPVSEVETTKPTIKFTSFDDIQEELITWLWHGYLPCGKLTILAGPGGIGKSTIAFDLAARVSAGGEWPDGSPGKKPGNVLIWSSEDDLADTIKPRLMAAGATDRVYAISVERGRKDQPFDPVDDMDLLREGISQLKGGLALLIIDPVVSVVKGDMHKANIVRAALQPLLDLAQEHKTAVLGITHTTKESEEKRRNAAESVLGSGAFSAVPRMVLLAAKDKKTGRGVLARAKANITVDRAGFTYAIKPVTQYSKSLGISLPTTRIEWGEQVEGTAEDLLAGLQDESKPDEVEEFVRTTLKDGPVPSELFTRLAVEAGIARNALQAACRKLGVKSRKADSKDGQWFKVLPEEYSLPEGGNSSTPSLSSPSSTV